MHSNILEISKFIRNLCYQYPGQENIFFSHYTRTSSKTGLSVARRFGFPYYHLQGTPHFQNINNHIRLASDNNQIFIMDQQTKNFPNKYFDLIQKVGSNGFYQKRIFYLSLLIWYIFGNAVMGITFLFLNPQYNCQSIGIQGKDCQPFVCSRNSSQWHLYLNQKLLQSISTQFGPFLCDRQFTISFIKSIIFTSQILGLYLFGKLSDNYGRRPAVIISCFLNFAGVLILACSLTIQMTAFGIFMEGFGVSSAARITTIIMVETVEQKIRQKYTVLNIIGFGLSGTLIGILYYFMRYWRIVVIFFYVIPSLMALVMSYFYVKEIPRLLIKKGIQEALVQLNQIGMLNKNQSELISRSDIQQVKSFQQINDFDNKQIRVSIMDLFYYPSLRKNTIFLSLTGFFAIFVYNGPVFLIDKLKFNVFIAQSLICFMEVLSYFVSYFIVTKTRRKTIISMLLLISVICTGIQIFSSPSTNCHTCFKNILQIFLMIVNKFSVSIVLGFFVTFLYESFPSRIRTTGVTFCSSIQALGSSFGLFAISYANRKGINSMLILTAAALFALLSVWFTKETYNLQLQNEIQQIKQTKLKIEHKQQISYQY